MYATPEQIEMGLWDYVDSEFVARLGGLQKLAVLTMEELYRGKGAQMAQQFANNWFVKSADVVDQSGRYDIDRVKQVVLSAMDRGGMSKITYPIPVIGPVDFSRSDIEKLHQAISAHI